MVGGTRRQLVAGTAALTVCLGAVGGQAHARTTQQKGQASSVVAAPAAALVADPVQLNEGNYFTFVGLVGGNEGIEVAPNGVITVQFSDFVDVSSVTATIEDGDELTVTPDEDNQTVDITAPATLPEGDQYVLIQNLGTDWGGAVQSSFKILLDDEGDDAVVTGTSLNVTSTNNTKVELKQGTEVTFALPQLAEGIPGYDTTSNPGSTLVSGTSVDFDLDEGTATVTVSSDAKIGDAQWAMTFKESTTEGFNNIDVKQDVTIAAASTPTPTETSTPTPTETSTPTPTETSTPTPTISSETWVDAIFDDVLGREPTATERAIWVAKLNAKTTNPYTIALELTRTKEWRAEWIQANYDAWLDRAGTPNGVAYWQRWMDRGLSPQGVQIKFLASGERWRKSGSDPTKWITGMYLDVLGRAPTAGLLSHWNKRLNSGWSRDRAATEFILHRDFLYPLVDEEYEYMLDKESIRPARVSYWVNRLKSRARYERLIAGLAGTNDYEAKLEDN